MIKQIATRYDNTLVALTASGELYTQQFKGGWEKVEGPEGAKIVSIAVKLNGIGVVITASGQIFEQYRVGSTLAITRRLGIWFLAPEHISPSTKGVPYQWTISILSTPVKHLRGKPTVGLWARLPLPVLR
jgi:hypothetical protein